MRSSLTLGTRGKLSSKVKRTLVIASFGFIEISNVVPGGGGSNDSSGVNENIKNSLNQRVLSTIKQRKLAVIEDEKDLVLIIKIFTQCL
jgi:hypothetical protein